VNVINELAALLGPLRSPATYLGVVSIFGAPILAFLALKGFLTKGLKNAGPATRVLRSLAGGASVLAGVLWIVALLSVFPGFLICSVYCFLGLALPILGLATGVAGLLLITSTLTRQNDANRGA
jgi:hypothetical protein